MVTIQSNYRQHTQRRSAREEAAAKIQNNFRAFNNRKHQGFGYMQM